MKKVIIVIALILMSTRPVFAALGPDQEQIEVFLFYLFEQYRAEMARLGAPEQDRDEFEEARFQMLERNHQLHEEWPPRQEAAPNPEGPRVLDNKRPRNPEEEGKVSNKRPNLTK